MKIKIETIATIDRESLNSLNPTLIINGSLALHHASLAVTKVRFIGGGGGGGFFERDGGGGGGAFLLNPVVFRVFELGRRDATLP